MTGILKIVTTEGNILRKEVHMIYLTLAARILIGAPFVLAGFSKIFDPGDFAVSIRSYMMLPPGWTNLAAMTLPWIEIGAGSFLILGIQTRPSALLITGMLGAFLAALVHAYSIGLDIDCSCFISAVSSSGRIGIYHLVRDGILFLISLFVLVTDRGDLSIFRLESEELLLAG